MFLTHTVYTTLFYTSFFMQGVCTTAGTPGNTGNLNFIDAAGKFNYQLKYNNMPIAEPNLVTSLNLRNCHLTIFVQFYSCRT